jgi:hypothetical protein
MQDRNTAGNTGIAKAAVQWLNQFFFVSNLVNLVRTSLLSIATVKCFTISVYQNTHVSINCM